MSSSDSDGAPPPSTRHPRLASTKGITPLERSKAKITAEHVARLSVPGAKLAAGDTRELARRLENEERKAEREEGTLDQFFVRTTVRD